MYDNKLFKKMKINGLDNIKLFQRKSQANNDLKKTPHNYKIHRKNIWVIQL